MKPLLVAVLLVLVAGCGGGGNKAAKQATASERPAKSEGGLEFRLVAAMAGPAVSPQGSVPSTNRGLVGVPFPLTKGQTLEQTMAWAANPPSAWDTKFATFTCPKDSAAPVVDDPDQPLLACDADGDRYLLTKVVIAGSSLKSASASAPLGMTDWAVDLQLGDKDDAVDTFTTISQKLFENRNASRAPAYFAIVLGGEVLSAPYFSSVISNGRLEIAGFDEASAKALAARL